MDKQLDGVLDWLFGADLLAGEAVERRARELFLDTLGCMVAGLAATEVAALAARLAALDGGTVRLPGAKENLTPSNAAFVAAMAATTRTACAAA
jgi:2-methylcitrate dehydratase PrpD